MQPILLLHGAIGVKDQLEPLAREQGRAPLLTATALAAIQQPCLLLLGDRDKMVSLEETAATFRLLPAGQMGVLPGTGHPLEQVDPRRLAFEITQFLEGTRV